MMLGSFTQPFAMSPDEWEAAGFPTQVAYWRPDGQSGVIRIEIGRSLAEVSYDLMTKSYKRKPYAQLSATHNSQVRLPRSARSTRIHARWILGAPRAVTGDIRQTNGPYARGRLANDANTVIVISWIAEIVAGLAGYRGISFDLIEQQESITKAAAEYTNALNTLNARAATLNKLLDEAAAKALQPTA
jgi:hypothetical protein